MLIVSEHFRGLLAAYRPSASLHYYVAVKPWLSVGIHTHTIIILPILPIIRTIDIPYVKTDRFILLA